MALTHDEKQRIYEEEKERIAAQKKLKKRPLYKKPWAWLLLIIVIFVVPALIGSSNSEGPKSGKPTITPEQAKAQSIQVNYKDLLRNNNQYIGKIVRYQGKVDQVYELSDKFQSLF